MAPRPLRAHCLSFWVLWSLLVNAGALAAGQQPRTAEGPVAAPVVQFPAQGISLEEAVQRALENDPNIQRADVDVAFRRGVLQQQTGIFDTILSGSADYSRRVQEMTDAAKEEQQKKRNELQGLIDAGPGTVAKATDARDLIRRVRDNQISAQQLSATSPRLAATLITLDELIRTSPPAQAALLTQTRQQVLDDALRIADSELDAQRTILTRAIEERTNLGAAPVDEVFTDATLSVQASKLFRTGVSLTPFFDGAFNSTGFRGKPHQVQFGGKGLTDLFTFHAGVSGNIPLGRDRGAAAIAAPERASRIEADASTLTLEHRRAASVLSTVQAYWALRAAQESTVIAAESLGFQDQLVTITQNLVKSGDLAGVESSRAQAAQANARAGVEDSQRRLSDARVELAIAMGVSATDADATLPRASDAFPNVPAPAAQTTVSGLVTTALAERQDLKAADRLTEAGDVLARGARLNLRPVLDVGLGTWYTAIDEGTASQAVDRWVGPSAKASVQFERPFGNNALRGELAQREASARLRQIDETELNRRVRLGVIQSQSTLQESVTRVEQSQSAVTLYQTTIDAELARLRNGDATVLDLIVTQQQQVGARLDLVAARFDLANRIARLRYETGTLVTSGKVAPQSLVTIPGGAR